LPRSALESQNGEEGGAVAGRQGMGQQV